ncbi:AAA family ATPase [Planosporangium thailandense]|uniref:AAA family ATPase n=1 Tax=Planosporangium thailandense TaxID=765197 RepID=A0ABX0Y3Y2_9ACTN|nr:AAA family ATPase [Planosporangium thailandense]
MQTERIVGRRSELSALDDAVEQMSGSTADRTVACVIQGEPGIGKTTLWRYGVQRARERGCEVLACRPAEPENLLSFAGLTDLVDTVPDAVFRALPAPQRHALDVALLRATPDGAPPDPRAVNLATLSLVRLLAASRPVILAVDDAQWLDPASAGVLSYVARRSVDHAVGVLATVRSDERYAEPVPFGLGRAFDPDRIRRIRLDRLSPAELYRLVRTRTGLHLAKPDLLRLGEASGGNPFLALEVARSIQRTGWPEPSAPLPAPATLDDAAVERVTRLPPETREVLLVAAALHHPRTALIRAALGMPGPATPGLEAAEDAGVVEVRGGQVRFTHPLFASAVYSAAATERRRVLHARLATVVPDLDERARHLALAADGPDAEVAGVIADAARQTQDRGAPAMAAELWLLASHRTPPGDPRGPRRAVSAAECLFSAGDAMGARTILETAAAGMPPGPHRARALLWLASILFYDGSPRDAVAALQRAIPEAAGDRLLTGTLQLRIAWFADYDADLRVRSAARARELLTGVADAALRACAELSVAFFGFLAGRGADHETLERGRALLPDRAFSWEVEFGRSMLNIWAKSFDIPRARTGWLAKYRRAQEIGDEPAVPHALLHLVEIECWLGNLDLAARYAEEMVETIEQTGQRRWRGQALYTTALVAAYRCDADPAVAAATEGLALAESFQDTMVAVLHLSVLGFVELSRGAPEAADRYLTRAADAVAGMGMREPARYTFFGDQVEAALHLGDVDRAAGLVADLDRRAAVAPYPYLVCVAARSRALLALARGDLAGAGAAAEAAVRAHADLPMPFEQARTLLVHGQVLRRRKEKRAAGEALTRAGEMFQRLGANRWHDRVVAELQSLGLRRSSPDQLTPAERRVASLVATGHTNDEVAAALFLSRRTVEAHLSRIYRKVGVRSRTELAQAVAGQGSA